MPTTLGTVIFKDYRPTRDAFVVEKLRKAGAIMLGKTTLSEFARGDTYGSMFGVTRNPYDPERTVGGSSGGSGASVAANFSTVALGEETLASIRRPGGWNAIVSMRPTPGLVSRSGMWDGYPTIAAQMGPMARTVADLAKLLDVMVGYDPEDPLTAAGVGKYDGSYTRFLDRNGLKGARIGILRESVGNASGAELGGFQESRRGVREEHRGVESRGRCHRRSRRHPGLQGAARQALRRRRRLGCGAEAVSCAQSEFSLHDAPGHRQLAGSRKELLQVHG
jgi:Asp-tRNA(Asn)/Glu-tRNA(Gln) amidotransferase A subunit family amidase